MCLVLLRHSEGAYGAYEDDGEVDASAVSDAPSQRRRRTTAAGRELRRCRRGPDPQCCLGETFNDLVVGLRRVPDANAEPLLDAQLLDQRRTRVPGCRASRPSHRL